MVISKNTPDYNIQTYTLVNTRMRLFYSNKAVGQAFDMFFETDKTVVPPIFVRFYPGRNEFQVMTFMAQYVNSSYSCIKHKVAFSSKTITNFNTKLQSINIFKSDLIQANNFEQ